ncbi:MAG TPA: hypothetical protein VGW10_16095 [Solirubrobacteraceae bacterium]|nr:hypothetical protein [Solirubrobacteraceae bacterium]
MTSTRSLALALAALALALSSASAAEAAPGERGTVWKVVEATHTSSATYRSEDATGSSSMAWKLAKPIATAPNRLTVGAPGPLVAGYGVVNVAGTVEASATTKRGSCHLAGATGSTEYGYDVPVPITLNLSAAPEGGLQVGLAARYAKLGSPYFGSECSLRGTEYPEKAMKITKLPANALKRKRVVLTWKGSAAGEVDAYTWSTRIVLKRR